MISLNIIQYLCFTLFINEQNSWRGTGLIMIDYACCYVLQNIYGHLFVDSLLVILFGNAVLIDATAAGVVVNTGKLLQKRTKKKNSLISFSPLAPFL
ncbi:hypothetical protein CDL12_14386 [Handroanthus impetiginosus]|uniref:Uncharacterized protein n=1 Tax=Handroanthus impetiginosus TaxID=429701 RepID=A0A2G9H6R4_9LAMI|nr:hypothetical protein CDL12_14386 [Handroanthus impetiginosus]